MLQSSQQLTGQYFSVHGGPEPVPFVLKGRKLAKEVKNTIDAEMKLAIIVLFCFILFIFTILYIVLF